MGGALSAVWDALRNSAGAFADALGLGGGTTAGGAARHLFDPIANLLTFLQQLFSREKGAWDTAAPEIKDGASGLGEIAYADANAWTRLLQVIIPGSLRWLDGHTHQWVDLWIHNVYDNYVRFNDAEWADQHKWDAAIVNWRSFWVDPNIRDWRNWHSWFDGWPHKMVEWVHEWNTNPPSFAAWATPVIAKPLLDFYNERRHKDLRDLLTEIVVDSTPDIVPHVEAATLAILNTPGY